MLSAREIFKQEEIKVGCKTYFTGDYRVIKYGKINKDTVFRIRERSRYSGPDVVVEVIKMVDDDYKLSMTPFYNEQEPSGGRIVGIQYKDALEYAYEFIKSLKSLI